MKRIGLNRRTDEQLRNVAEITIVLIMMSSDFHDWKKNRINHGGEEIPGPDVEIHGISLIPVYFQIAKFAML